MSEINFCEILKNASSIAVVGFSSNPNRTSREITAYLQWLAVIIIILISSTGITAAVDSLIITNETWVKIDSIEITGNDITEEFVILRELTFKAGDTVNGEILSFNKERVYSLGIFNFVSIYARQNESFITAVVDVKESWYIYPIPFLSIRDKNLDRSSYGLSLLFKNFRGRNETVQAVASFGYDKFFLLSYYNPVLIENPELELMMSVLYQTPINKSPKAELIYGASFDYRLAVGILSIGKRINHFNQLYGFLGYNYVEAPTKNFFGITASDAPIDRAMILGAGYIYDSRNLKQFPNEGIFGKIEFTNKGFGNSKIDYNILWLDFREYRSFYNKFTTKWRLAYRHSFGKFVPLYDNSFLGYEEYVRGHRNDEREGNNMFLTSLEMSFPIIRDINVSLDLPLLPTRLTSARIGLFLNGFIDTGITYNNGESWNVNNFDSGWGFGITILVLPYNALRLEYAFDELRNGEFLIGTGFSF